MYCRLGGLLIGVPLPADLLGVHDMSITTHRGYYSCESGYVCRLDYFDVSDEFVMVHPVEKYLCPAFKLVGQ